MSVLTATRELTDGQINTCQVIHQYHEVNPFTQHEPPIHRLGRAFTDMMIMLDMSSEELSAETGVDAEVIDRLEWWGSEDNPAFLDVMKLAHFFSLPLALIEERMFGYKGPRLRWR